MEFRRALRILIVRWWLLIVAGVVGASLAVGIAYLYNSRIQPRVEARATVEYLRLEGETDAVFDSRLAKARTAGLGLLTDLSEEVETDKDSGSLSFVVEGDDQETVTATAGRLRDEFLALDLLAGQGEVWRGRLQELQTEIDQARDQLSALRPAPVAIDPALAAQREQLAFEISELRQRIASLRIQIAYPELATGDPATLEAELVRSESLLGVLSAGLAELPEQATTSTTETLDMLVLQRHVQDLEAQYVTIALGLLEEPEAIGPITEVAVVDLTAERIPWRLAGPAGFLAAVLGAAVLLLLVDRVKRPLWGLEDASPLAGIGVIDRARPGAGVRPWYPRAGPAKRRRQVQALRAALDRAVGAGSVSIGLVGVSVPEPDVQALAADLAASVGASGHRVLLIDAAFAHPSDLPEYGSEPPDLADLLGRRDGEDAAAIIKQAVAERPEVITDLHALRAGRAADDTADLLAGRQFRMVLTAAAELDELVVVAAPTLGDPGTEVLSQRLDHLVLVCAARRTTRRQYQEAVADLTDRQASLFGTVLLEGRSPRAARPGRSASRGARRATRRDIRDSSEPTTGPPDQPGNAAPAVAEPAAPSSAESVVAASPARFEPPDDSPEPTIQIHPDLPDQGFPEKPEGWRPRARTARVGDGQPGVTKPIAGEQTPPKLDRRAETPLNRTPSSEQTTADTSSRDVTERPTLRDRLLPGRGTALQTPRSQKASAGVVETTREPHIIIDDRDSTVAADRAAAERYLVDQTLALVGIGTNVPEEEPGVVDAEGMVPVTSGAGSPTAAMRLERILFADAHHRAAQVERGLVHLLADGRDSLQRWIEHDFFPLHYRLSGQQPAVWHLASVGGAFQVLVAARNLDVDHLRLLRSHDVRRTMLGIRRSLAEAREAGDEARMADLRRRFADIRAFDQALTDLEDLELRSGRTPDPAAEFALLRGLGLLAGSGQAARADQAINPS